MPNYKPEGLLIDTPANRQAFHSLSALQEAHASGRILESRAVVCDPDHNLIVDMGAWRGIIPRDEAALGIAEGTTRDIAIISRVNKPVCYRITGFDQSVRRHRYPPAVPPRGPAGVPGQLYRSPSSPATSSTRVSPIWNRSGVSWISAAASPPSSRSTQSPSAESPTRATASPPRRTSGRSSRRCEPGGRVSLSHKELLGTWSENAAMFSAGETVAGIVRSVEEYGVFVGAFPQPRRACGTARGSGRRPARERLYQKPHPGKDEGKAHHRRFL